MEEFVNKIQEEIAVFDKEYLRKVQVCLQYDLNYGYD